MSLLEQKRIVLAVSGGIACYKAVELLRLLVKEGTSVTVAMTANAKKFVTPLTFEALSGQPVYHEIFGLESTAQMTHIKEAENADLMVVAPATANTIAKLAHGLADDPVSTLTLAFSGAVFVAPAMNDRMWANPAVQQNIETLKNRGVSIIEPRSGELACGSVGPGRLAEPAQLLEAIQNHFRRQQDLAGWNFLVTAGPTREPIDPVRYVSNPSSGKMGYAIAGRAQARGARVTLVSGPTSVTPPAGVQFVSCMQAEEMRAQVLKHFDACDALVMTAAVGDFAPESVSKEKIKKDGDQPLTLKLHPTPDILMDVSKVKKRQIVVGFAAESENVIQSALEKQQRKRLDLIVANDISAPGIGFQSDNNQVAIIRDAGNIEHLPKLTKAEIADILLDRILSQKKD